MQDIIADIYHAAAGTKPWSIPLTKIVARLDLCGCQLLGISTRHGSVLYSHVSDGAAAEQELDYIRTYHNSNPQLPLAMASAQGAWVYDEDKFRESQALANPFYRDRLISYGARYSANARLFDQDGEAVLIALVSRLRETGFDNKRHQLMQTLSFHLHAAAAIYQKTRRQATATVAGSELLQHIARPAFLFGTDRHLSFMNELGRRFVNERGIFLLARDRLTALDNQMDDGLSTALHMIDEGILRGSVPRRRILCLPQGHVNRAIVISLATFIPKESMQAFGPHPQVLLMVHDSASRTEPDILLWEVAFDLTASQLRVALCMFQGRSTLQTAAALKVSKTTVKSHLKELYRKTETSRQPQLVAMLNRLQTT